MEETLKHKISKLNNDYSKYLQSKLEIDKHSAECKLIEYSNHLNKQMQIIDTVCENDIELELKIMECNYNRKKLDIQNLVEIEKNKLKVMFQKWLLTRIHMFKHKSTQMN